MDYKLELSRIAMKSVGKHPALIDSIIDIYNLAMDEIDAGGSESNEYDLFMGSLEELTTG